MSQVTVTAITPPVTAVFTGALTIAKTVTIPPTSMVLPVASGQNDVVLLLTPILGERIRDVVHLTNLLQQQHQSQIPSHVHCIPN